MADRGGSTADIELDPLLKASRVVSAAIAVSLAGASPKISLAEMRALNMIHASGPLNIAAVADGLGVAASNASRTCDRLVSKGLVKRTVHADDRRHVVLTLTAAGRRIIGRMMAARRAVLQQVVERMTPEQQQLLEQAMTAFGAAADQLAEEGHVLSDGDGHLLRWLG